MTFALQEILSDDDYEFAARAVGARSRLLRPDLVIAPDGAPYLYRFHLIPRNEIGNVYMHIQVGSDPERPLHDHPWDNTSVILSGGYDEKWCPDPELHPHGLEYPVTRHLHKGDVVHRRASEAHRLLLPKEFKYTMTLFSTGPKVRDWGFWFKDGWRDHSKVLKLLSDGRSTMREEYRHD